MSDDNPRFVKKTAFHNLRTTLHFVHDHDNAAMNVKG